MSRRSLGMLDLNGCGRDRDSATVGVIRAKNGRKQVLRYAQNDKSKVSTTASELEAVAKFGVELAGVVVVEAAEGEAVIQQHAGVAYVECVHGDGVSAAKVFA
jgi:hypothetical protein